MLAIYGLNVALTSSDFLISPELSVEKLTGTAPASPQASIYSAGVALSETTHVSARVLAEGEWSALSEAEFTVPASGATPQDAEMAE